MGKTKIEWTDKTWNPIRGCTAISEGCRFCYAAAVAARFSGPGLPYEGLVNSEGKWNGKIMQVENHLLDPMSWGQPAMCFVNSMSDLFHENVTTDWIDKIFAVMALSPQHTFQILTKRPQRMMDYFNSKSPQQDVWFEAKKKNGEIVRHEVVMNWPLPNVWQGVSIEDQPTADLRIPYLVKTNAAVRFISYEPMLAPVNIVKWLPDLHWVIAGGESGEGARPIHPTWARSIRDQCVAAKVAFFFKQWGAWGWWQGGYAMRSNSKSNPSTFVNGDPDLRAQNKDFDAWMTRTGKKTAGRELDGQEWNQMPGDPI